jgi:hypothetical protein
LCRPDPLTSRVRTRVPPPNPAFAGNISREGTSETLNRSILLSRGENSTRESALKAIDRSIAAQFRLPKDGENIDREFLVALDTLEFLNVGLQ